MLFAVDMGNTNIVVGLLDGSRVVFEERLATNPGRTALEYAIDFKNLLELYRISRDEIDGAIISSVVPQLTEIIKSAVFKSMDVLPKVIGQDVDPGLEIRIDQPSTLGADLIVGAVGALEPVKPPVIIVDMGTATTVTYVDPDRVYRGGIILPGVMTSFGALVDKASQLTKIGISAPGKVIGTNTADCMRSGLVYGNASMIDGLIDRIRTEVGYPARVVATGGLASLIIPYCRNEILVDDSLLLRGLKTIYERNL